MKNKPLRFGLLLFVYTLLISIHLHNNTYYYIKAVRPSYYNRPTILDLDWAASNQIPVNKYLSKEQYELFKSEDFVVNNTKIEVKPFEISKSLFITISLIISVTLIVLNLNFNGIININKKH